MIVNRAQQNFMTLSMKRVDLIVVNQQDAQYMFTQPDLLEFAKKIKWMEPALEEKQQYLIISKKTGDFIKIMNKHNISY